MRIRNTETDKEVEQPRLQMSSMIDVVFLLLIFFVMTFQISAIEGDFQINPAQPGGEGNDRPPPPVFRVYLLADDTGQLSAIRFDGRQIADIDELRLVLRTIVEKHVSAGGSSGELSVELRSEQSLKYQFAIDALTAIRGTDAEQPLIDNVRFVAAR